MNIFIGSLPFAVKDEALKELFATYGEVSSARVVTDKFTGRSKGFGFVEMEDEVAAKKAIAELNGSEIQGRTIVVNEAKPREERPEGGYQRRDNGFRRS
ncbi:MAG: RNA-binding protein [Paludibacteraceae bacterium]|jgi:RNA recognition motif-containing protein|nr:RNA-binding protein [Paludibacteraceae bacterium]MDI9537582.1 RNA-binding protein [Bacteroidota bacterium]OQC34064.1 MAG: RNA recognition motif [Bacteroidetes bacterium ADurb.Bin057]HOA46871.1 RNA-binding protein [Paludibacteraceae bacterium]HOG36255.1 RNA-binding protein [Paludibacteraceae bacterium]